jgi:chromosome segregation ATPase
MSQEVDISSLSVQYENEKNRNKQLEDSLIEKDLKIKVLTDQCADLSKSFVSYEETQKLLSLRESEIADLETSNKLLNVDMRAAQAEIERLTKLLADTQISLLNTQKGYTTDEKSAQAEIERLHDMLRIANDESNVSKKNMNEMSLHNNSLDLELVKCREQIESLMISLEEVKSTECEDCGFLMQELNKDEKDLEIRTNQVSYLEKESLLLKAELSRITEDRNGLQILLDDQFNGGGAGNDQQQEESSDAALEALRAELEAMYKNEAELRRIVDKLMSDLQSSEKTIARLEEEVKMLREEISMNEKFAKANDIRNEKAKREEEDRANNPIFHDKLSVMVRSMEEMYELQISEFANVNKQNDEKVIKLSLESQNLRNSLESKVKLVADKEIEINGLKMEFEKNAHIFVAQKKTFDDDVAHLNNEINNKNEAIRELRVKLETALDAIPQLEILRQQVCIYEEVEGALKSTIKDQDNELRGLRDELLKSSVDLAKTSSMLEDAKAGLKSKEGVLYECQTSLSTLAGREILLEEKLQCSDDEINGMKADLERERERSQKSEQICTELNNEITKLREETLRFSMELKHVTTNRDEIKNRLQREIEVAEGLRIDFNASFKESNEWKSQVQNLTAHLDENTLRFEKELSEIRLDVDTKRDYLEELKIEIRHLEPENKFIRTELSNLHKLLETRDMEIVELQRFLQELQGIERKSSEDNKELDKTLSGLVLDLERANSTIDSLEAAAAAKLLIERKAADAQADTDAKAAKMIKELEMKINSAAEKKIKDSLAHDEVKKSLEEAAKSLENELLKSRYENER